ncbi:hypothetical protein C5167_037775 [Papaver somniferum]|uniref:Uncharacterized protein n=1 Tax=Papaver somniferum TaxID=3469 RepID=A0A4Y7I7B8_PAPSO|nr:uncharacterized protein LOC113290144 [Papaver somniferum]RZC44827.1 hypothetical protein C5167_037775 [Papaver somniferum]
MVAAADTQTMQDYSSKEDEEVFMMLKKKAGDGDIDQHVFKEISRTVSLDAVRQLGVALDDNIGYLNGRVDFPILILRMDGEDLLDFIKDPSYESKMMTIFSNISIRRQFNGNEDLSVKDYFMEAVKQLTVDHGMPPSSDAFVMNNIIQPSLEAYFKNVSGDSRGCVPDDNMTTFLLEEFEKFGHILVQHLKEEPIIVAHTQITFDGSKIKKLLTNKSNLLEKALDMAVIEIQRDPKSVLLPCKEILLLMFDHLGPLTGLPPYEAIHQIDRIVDKVLMKIKAENEEQNMKIMENEDKVKHLKMLMRMLLEHIILELEANKPISVSSNSVIHT